MRSQEVGGVTPSQRRDAWLFLRILDGCFNILGQKYLNKVPTVIVLVPNNDVGPTRSRLSYNRTFEGPVCMISCVSQWSCATQVLSRAGVLVRSHTVSGSWVRFPAGVMCGVYMRWLSAQCPWPRRWLRCGDCLPPAAPLGWVNYTDRQIKMLLRWLLHSAEIASGHKNTLIVSFRWLYTNKNITVNIFLSGLTLLLIWVVVARSFVFQ